jgi:rfaE bifunctional protein nucleotidyltransferase chain/domain
MIKSYLEDIKSKIHSDTAPALNIINSWKSAGDKIVFTNGCFDVLHRGHIELLSKAADYGNRLIIGLNTDDSVRRLKGPSRPVQDEYSRAMILAALEFTGMVIFFSDDTPEKLIEAVNPDVLIKGGDYKAEEIVGYDFVTANHGKVVIIKFVEGFSTTSILNRLKK